MPTCPTVYLVQYYLLINSFFLQLEDMIHERKWFLSIFFTTINPVHKTSIQYWLSMYAAAAKSCPTLCDSIDGSPPGSPIPGILQARTLEWLAISFSNAWKWKVKVKALSRAQLLATPWTIQPTRLLYPWDFPGKSTGVGCHCLLQN